MSIKLSQHSQSDIIWSALGWLHETDDIIAFSYSVQLQQQMNDLFHSIGDQLTLVHSDARRSIREYNGPDFSVQGFEVYSADIPLGNHYHKKAVWHTNPDLWKLSEVFVFDEGWGWLLLQQLDPEWKVMSRIEKIKIRIWDVLPIPPFLAHTLFLEPGTKFRWFRPYPFDPKDMDMNSHRLELPTS